MPEQDDRARYLSQKIADAQLDARSLDDYIDVSMCVGPPWCFLNHEEAKEEMADGCVLCEKYTISPTGQIMFSKSQSISNFGNN